MKIGFIDSGLGGVKVVDTALKMGLTGEIYLLADLKNNPYGEKSGDYIKKITLDNVSYLVSLGCKVIVIACNTATSAAIEDVRMSFPNIKIYGIEPAIKIAQNSSKKVLVLGTEVTLNGDKIFGLIDNLNIKGKLELVPTNELVKLIENSSKDDTIDAYLDNIFKNYDMDEFSHIVLGCTHYPIVNDNIKGVLNKYNSNIQIVDGSIGLVNNVLKSVIKSENTTIELILTKESEQFVNNACKILDVPFKVIYKNNN